MSVCATRRASLATPLPQRWRPTLTPGVSPLGKHTEGNEGTAYGPGRTKSDTRCDGSDYVARRRLASARVVTVRQLPTNSNARSAADLQPAADRVSRATGRKSLIISCRSMSPAPESVVVREVMELLEKRGALTDPPVSMAVSDTVALGIAELFRSPTLSGQVMDRLVRTGNADSDELIEAARFEQGYATAEGHAALHCLIGWVRSRVHRSAEHSRAS